MKRVVLRDRGAFKAREVLTTIVEQPPPNAGISYAEMRKRDRILDALDKCKEQSFVDIEDNDYEVLKGLLNAFQFGTAKRELRLILDDIANAKSPEDTPMLKLIDEAG